VILCLEVLAQIRVANNDLVRQDRLDRPAADILPLSEADMFVRLTEAEQRMTVP
jgi:hypothetical protein